MAILRLIKLRTPHKTVAMLICYVHTEDEPVLKAGELVASRRQVNTRVRRTKPVKQRLFKPTCCGLYPNGYNSDWEMQAAVLGSPLEKGRQRVSHQRTKGHGCRVAHRPLGKQAAFSQALNRVWLRSVQIGGRPT